MGFEVRHLTQEEKEKTEILIEKELGRVKYSLGKRCAIDVQEELCLIRYGGEGTYEEEQRDYLAFIYKKHICKIVMIAERIDNNQENYYKVKYKFYSLETPSIFFDKRKDIMELVKDGLWAICKHGEKSDLRWGMKLEGVLFDETDIMYGEIKRWE